MLSILHTAGEVRVACCSTMRGAAPAAARARWSLVMSAQAGLTVGI